MSSTSTQSIHQKDRPAPARTVILAKSRKTLRNAFTTLRDFDAGVVWPRGRVAAVTGIERRDELGGVNLFHADLDGTGRERPAGSSLPTDRPVIGMQSYRQQGAANMGATQSAAWLKRQRGCAPAQLTENDMSGTEISDNVG